MEHGPGSEGAPTPVPWWVRLKCALVDICRVGSFGLSVYMLLDPEADISRAIYSQLMSTVVPAVLDLLP